MADRPRVLIEDWLPFATIGAESLRESGYGTPFPGPVRLHVWWARRPLMISRAAVVASMLPAYDASTVGSLLAERFASEDEYKRWVVHVLGIRGDPVAGRRLIQWAKERDITIKGGPYGGAPRAFTVSPSPEDLAVLRQLLAATWGTEQLTVLDPFSGGGSIPFEAMRYGFTTIANELNPVAAVILKATLDYPAQFGESLAADIRHWGLEWARRVKERLDPYFPKQSPGENIQAYLWARTVACPITGKPVPLSPNWWLSKDPPVAARILVQPDWEQPRFEIARDDAIDFDPDAGTVSRGTARSPWTGETVDDEYIKREAQAGRMGQMLYAVAVKRRGGFGFRAPAAQDLAAVQAADGEARRTRAEWEAGDLIPTEAFPGGNDPRPLHYGMRTWSDMFAPRQLLAMATCTAVLRGLRTEIRGTLDEDKADAMDVYMADVLDKAVIYNNRLCRFDPGRGTRSVFDRHDFAFVSSHAEFDAAANLLPWCVDQVADACRDVAKLVQHDDLTLYGSNSEGHVATIVQGSATDLSSVADKGVHAVITDPPYYNNVMYAELADFFYVWLKRTVGHLYPDWFAATLTDKDEEAVANSARFAGLGRNKNCSASAELGVFQGRRYIVPARKEDPHEPVTTGQLHGDREGGDPARGAA